KTRMPMSRTATLRVVFARVGSGELPPARPCQVISPRTTSAARIRATLCSGRSRIIGTSSVSTGCAGGAAVVVHTSGVYHTEKDYADGCLSFSSGFLHSENSPAGRKNRVGEHPRGGCDFPRVVVKSGRCNGAMGLP